MTHISTVNAALRKLHPGLKLRGGDGYQYFTLYSGDVVESHSVYVYRVKYLTLEEWLTEARWFLNDLRLRRIAI